MPTQLVFEFGSNKVPPVIEAIRRVIGSLSYSLKCLPTGTEEWTLSDGSLESAEARLERGEISAFSLHPQDGMIRYALALSPSCDGARRSFYLGTVEYTEKNYTPVWEQILSTPGLRVACLGFEEGVELEDEHLTVETFPWDQWPLVVGALRDASGCGSWTIRSGPEMRRIAAGQNGGHRIE